MASSSEDVNAATATLKCDGPFEVLQLSVGVYNPLEIKRQYRRLALILHPDKNRHPDAEAAFKKLTAAFEKLHDPARQALSRAEAERNSGGGPRHRHRQTRGGSSSDAGGSSGGGGGGDDDSTRSRGSTSGGGGGTPEAPRWCREGEYVPEAERPKEPAPDTGRRKERPIDEFMEDFEQQERVFKEEVAQAKERNADRKRARAEARSAAEQERMNRLREDVLGSGDGDGTGEVEANTASWQKFNSTTTPKRKATRGSTPGHRRENSRKGGSGGSGGVGVGGGEAEGQEGGSAGVTQTDPPKVAGEETAGPGFVCWVCRRGFKSAKGLANHEAKSELHEINVQLREFLTP